jgi:hypothetical protein
MVKKQNGLKIINLYWFYLIIPLFGLFTYLWVHGYIFKDSETVAGYKLMNGQQIKLKLLSTDNSVDKLLEKATIKAAPEDISKLSVIDDNLEPYLNISSLTTINWQVDLGWSFQYLVLYSPEAGLLKYIKIEPDTTLPSTSYLTYSLNKKDNDFYSTVHFIPVEDWSNKSFFTFINVMYLVMSMLVGAMISIVLESLAKKIVTYKLKQTNWNCLKQKLTSKQLREYMTGDEFNSRDQTRLHIIKGVECFVYERVA